MSCHCQLHLDSTRLDSPPQVQPPLIMEFSPDEFRTAGDWSPPERKYCSSVCPDWGNWLSTVPAGSTTGSFFISSLEGGGRNAVAFHVENGTWQPDLATPIPWSSSSNTDVQLVGSDGKLFVFSEQQRDRSVHHCIDELEFQNPKAGVLTCRWRSFVEVKKSGGRGLQVYPEHTGVEFREGKHVIFSLVSRKKLYFLLSLCFAILPTGACAEDQSIQDYLSSNSIPLISWESLDIAKAMAGTLLAGVMMIKAARFAWGIFRHRQAPDNRFDIMQGLENSDTPTKGNPSFAILPDILA